MDLERKISSTTNVEKITVETPSILLTACSTIAPRRLAYTFARIIAINSATT